MIIKYDYHIWSSYMIITYDDQLIYDDHIYRIIIHDHHIWSSLDDFQNMFEYVFELFWNIIQYFKLFWTRFWIILKTY